MSHTMRGPQLVVLDDPVDGYRLAVSVGNQWVLVESMQDGLLYLCQEYALNFLLPLWLKDLGEGFDPLGAGLEEAGVPVERLHFPPVFSPEPLPTPYFRAYTAQRLLEDIRRWAAHLLPADVEVEKYIEGVADELRSRMLGNGGWDDSLSLVS